MIGITIIERDGLLIITIPKPKGALVLVVTLISGNSYTGACFYMQADDARLMPDNKTGKKANTLVAVTLKRESTGAVTLKYNSGEAQVTLFGMPVEGAVGLYEMELLTK